MVKLQEYTKEWLEELCKESFSLAEVLRKAGRQGGGAQQTLRSKIAKWDIDTSHFTGQLWNKGKTKETDDRILQQIKNQEIVFEEAFIENSLTTRKVIRAYILRHNLIPYECSFCGSDGNWMNKQIALDLDHINGKNNDHRLENLRWLCPNCHATTDTYRGKNIKIEKSEIKIEPKIKTTSKQETRKCIICNKEFNFDKNRDQKYCSQKCSSKSQIIAYSENYDINDRNTLKELIKQKSFTEIGRIFGVSDNAIRKHCIKHKLPSKKSDINTYTDDEWKQI